MNAKPVLRLKKRRVENFPACPPREMPALDAKEFWFIWLEGNRAPRHRHATEASARAELTRLHEQAPHKRLHLFRAERLEDEPA